MKFSIKDFFSKCDQIQRNPHKTADLVTFPEEILNGKLHFQCSGDFIPVKFPKSIYSQIEILEIFSNPNS